MNFYFLSFKLTVFLIEILDHFQKHIIYLHRIPPIDLFIIFGSITSLAY